MRILLVEDNTHTAQTLTKLLKRAEASLEIFCVGTLAEGLVQSTALQVDVTILDLCLPDAKDWRETARAIQKFSPPVVVITELDGPEVIVECHKYGAQQVFNKRIALQFVSALLSALTSARLRILTVQNNKANA